MIDDKSNVKTDKTTIFRKLGRRFSWRHESRQVGPVAKNRRRPSLAGEAWNKPRQDALLLSEDSEDSLPLHKRRLSCPAELMRKAQMKLLVDLELLDLSSDDEDEDSGGTQNERAHGDIQNHSSAPVLSISGAANTATKEPNDRNNYGACLIPFDFECHEDDGNLLINHRHLPKPQV